MNDITNIESYDYQEVTPEVIPSYNNFSMSYGAQPPLLRYMVSLDDSHNQPGCFSTCKQLADPARPNSVYNFNSCMMNCDMAGVSSGIIPGSVPRK